MSSSPPGDRLEKKDNPVKTLVGDSLYKELNILADADERSLSEFVERVLSKYVYGNRLRRAPESEGPHRDEQSRTGPVRD